MNDKTMFNLTYGLFVLTASLDGKDNGCIINTAGQVTAVPNRISIAVNKSNFTHDMILASGKFNVSILSEEADSIFKRFGFQSGRDVNKFDGYEHAVRGENGIYYVTEGTNGFISAQVETTLDLGTHTLFIAGVTDMDVLSDIPSTTYTYYQNRCQRQKARRALPSGAAASAATNTKATFFQMTLSVPSASIRPLILKKLLAKPTGSAVNAAGSQAAFKNK